MLIRIPAFDLHRLASYTLSFLLVFSFVGLSPFATSSGLDIEMGDTGGGNFLRQLVFISLWASSFFCFIKLSSVYEFKKIAWFLVLVVWCILSIAWADHPSISVRRVFLLLITASTIFMLVSCLTLKQVIDCLTVVLASLVIISLISIPVLPGAVHMGAELFDTGLEGNWKGIFIHKNHAGPALVVAISLFLYQYSLGRKKMWLLLSISALIFLAFTKSKTSLALLIPSLLFGLMMMRLLKYKVFSAALIVFYILLISLLILFRESILDAFIGVLDNPEAFTGRATIWDMVIRAIGDHFWLGVGYGSVWSVGDEMLLATYAFGWVDWVFTLTHSHNGYLEAFISLGFIGFLLVLLVFIVLPIFKAVSFGGGASHPFIYIFFSSFFFFSLHNMLETDLLNSADGRWFMMLILYFCLYLKSDCKSLESS
ncbi:O-antigen ligase family protein [Bowmanella pacifica]|uniref:O-antigen ligase family protein n=1 Tax=Bowmanella pacifica TaxID=502051 RepID=UPI00166B7604|nr:O-antigen ligase family protein [Bowmanella pacifica]